jgi:hypothetical protein
MMSPHCIIPMDQTSLSIPNRSSSPHLSLNQQGFLSIHSHQIPYRSHLNHVGIRFGRMFKLRVGLTHTLTAFHSSSPAPRPSRIGRKARPRTEEGIFPLPASQKGVNGRTLVMENLPSTWTMALVTRWGSRHGELNFVLVDHGLRKAVLDYKRSEDSRRACADKPIFLFDDVFLVYWRPAQIQREQEKSSKHLETEVHLVPDVTKPRLGPPGASDLDSETIEPNVSGVS